MVKPERFWNWLSLGFAAAAMMTSLFALASDPSVTFWRNSDVDYLDQTPDEQTLDQMRGLGSTSSDN